MIHIHTCRYAELDAHALACPTSVTNSMAQLVAHLLKPARNNEERVRVLCRWVAANISYNAAGFRSGNLGDNSADAVLRNRTSVCAGYANLLGALLAEAKVQAHVVSGWAKGVGWIKGPQGRTDHAWTVVNLSDNTAPGSQSRWALIDSTWAAGALGDTGFERRYEDFYFLTRPDLLIQSHLPQDSKWTLLPSGKTPSYPTWAGWVRIKPVYRVALVSHPDPEIHLPPGCRDVNVTLEVYDQKPSSVTITAQLDGQQVDCSNQDGFMRTFSLSGLSRRHELVVELERTLTNRSYYSHTVKYTITSAGKTA
jgi:hypothetical protein